ncbi:MAG: LytTR family DNA-binding domain-containing protein [Spirosomataceae bacterium]
MKLRCIAIDDEPLALEILIEDLSAIEFVEVTASFLSAIHAQEYLKDHTVDLVVSDIQMPTLTGMQFLRTFKNPPMFIFTTAYEQFAIEGFELMAVDYLLKPFSAERLLAATQRAYELFLLKNQPKQSVERRFFYVFAEYQKVKIYEDEIIYIEGLKDYVKIFLVNHARPILTRLNLKAIESKLSELSFCRVHQSFIVAIDKVTSVQKNSLIINQFKINIGPTYQQEFERKIGV